MTFERAKELYAIGKAENRLWLPITNIRRPFSYCVFWNGRFFVNNLECSVIHSELTISILKKKDFSVVDASDFRTLNEYINLRQLPLVMFPDTD